MNTIKGTFEANPHLYDYIHCLNFSPAGVVEMEDGAGQMINALVRGRFSVQKKDHQSMQLHFSDLREVKQKPWFLAQAKVPDHTPVDYSDVVLRENPDYQVEEPIRPLAPISILVTHEEGIFPFAQQVVWKVPDKQQWPCLLYHVRYVFEVDPLEQVNDNRTGRLYYQQEGWKEPDTQYYYCRDDKQKLTLQQLDQMGISLS